MIAFRLSSSWIVLSIASAAMLAGCDRGQGDQTMSNAAAAALPALPPAVPMTAGAATPPVYAPALAALPNARPVRIARLAQPRDRYAYVDRAYGQSDAIGAAPPDYGFDYRGVRPWVWQTGDRSREIVEPVDGGYRYYYYQPGADAPYFVRDPSYGYAYDDGSLVGVYDDYGRPLPDDDGYRQAAYAARYLARAQGLYAASLANAREGVIAANWAARRAQIEQARAQWAQQQARDTEWQAYHDAHAAQAAAYWQIEHARREQAAARFAGWQQRGFQGAPPQFYAPPRPAGGWNRMRGWFGSGQPPAPPARPVFVDRRPVIAPPAVVAAPMPPVAFRRPVAERGPPRKPTAPPMRDARPVYRETMAAVPAPDRTRSTPADRRPAIAQSHFGPAHVGPVHVGPVHVGPVHVGPVHVDSVGVDPARVDPPRAHVPRPARQEPTHQVVVHRSPPPDRVDPRPAFQPRPEPVREMRPPHQPDRAPSPPREAPAPHPEPHAEPHGAVSPRPAPQPHAAPAPHAPAEHRPQEHRP